MKIWVGLESPMSRDDEYVIHIPIFNGILNPDVDDLTSAVHSSDIETRVTSLIQSNLTQMIDEFDLSHFGDELENPYKDLHQYQHVDSWILKTMEPQSE